VKEVPPAAVPFLLLSFHLSSIAIALYTVRLGVKIGCVDLLYIFSGDAAVHSSEASEPECLGQPAVVTFRLFAARTGNVEY